MTLVHRCRRTARKNEPSLKFLGRNVYYLVDMLQERGAEAYWHIAVVAATDIMRPHSSSWNGGLRGARVRKRSLFKNCTNAAVPLWM